MSSQYKVIQVRFKSDYTNGVSNAIIQLEELVNKACQFTSWEPIGGITIIQTTDKFNIMSQSLKKVLEFNNTDDDSESDDFLDDDWIDEVDN